VANNISEWSVTDASNNTGSAPDFPVEGQAPSTVNDTMRTIYGAVARWYQDTNGTLETAGSSNAYTLTTNNARATLADQSMLVFNVDRANTGAATLAVDGLDAKAMRIRGAALVANDLLEDVTVIAVYNATDDAYDLIVPPLPVDIDPDSDSQVIEGDWTFTGAVEFNTGAVTFDGTITGGATLTGQDNASAAEVGFKGAPQTTHSAASSYPIVLADAGKHIYLTVDATGATIPANGTIAFPIGTAIAIVNDTGGNVTISITTDTLELAGLGTTGSRTLSDNGVACILKVTATVWKIVGAGVS